MDAVIPNFKILLIQLLTFGLGMIAIWKLYIGSLRDHLKARREGIAKDLATAEAARKEAEELRVQLLAERQSMAEELKKAKDEARADVAKLREELLAKAKVEQETLLKQARTQIQTETERAFAEVRVQAAALVVEATGALLTKKLDQEADKALAEKLVASVKVSKN
jgi:F-type H+-transporting ATPase subunit b